MAISEKSNQGLMKAIKRMHTLVESDDLELSLIHIFTYVDTKAT